MPSYGISLLLLFIHEESIDGKTARSLWTRFGSDHYRVAYVCIFVLGDRELALLSADPGVRPFGRAHVLRRIPVPAVSAAASVGRSNLRSAPSCAGVSASSYCQSKAATDDAALLICGASIPLVGCDEVSAENRGSAHAGGGLLRMQEQPSQG